MNAVILTSLLLSAFAELRFTADSAVIFRRYLVDLLARDMPPEIRQRVRHLLCMFDGLAARLDGYATNSEIDSPSYQVAPPLTDSNPVPPLSDP